MKRQALVAANMMVVRAAVFVAGVADQECASDQLVIAAARLAAEAAAANVRNRMAEMLLADRTLARPGLATIVGHRERTLPQDRDVGHCRMLARARKANKRAPSPGFYEHELGKASG